MKNRFQKSTAVIIALFLVAGTVSMSFTTVNTYAGIVKGNTQEDDEDDKSLLDKGKDAAEKGKDAVSDKAKDVAETGKNAAKKGKEAAAEKAKAAAKKVNGWYTSIDKKEFKRGWDHAVDVATSSAAANMGNKYVYNVSLAVEVLRNDINASMGSGRGIAQEAGFVAEKWAVDTFNIDAIRSGSSSRAYRPASNEWASADIETNFDTEASLKYYKTAEDSANAQAKTVIERYREYKAKSNNPKSFKEYMDEKGYDPDSQDDLLKSIYDGQERIIPADQLDEATAYIEGRIDKLSTQPGDVSAAKAKAYQETLDGLRDRLQDPKGVESKPLTAKQLQALTELAEEGKFDPTDPRWGFALSQIITPKYIVKQAVNTGKKTAALNIAIKLGPEVYDIILEGIETGEINEEDFKRLGADALTAGSEGFLEGSISSAILTMCKAGRFGPQLVNVSPDLVGAMTVIVIDSIRYGYALSNGDITPMQYGDLMAEELVTSAGAMAAGAGLTLLFGNYLILTMAGCMAGGMLATMGYKAGKHTVLEIRDAGGFAAVVPLDTVKGTLVDTKEVTSLKIKNAPTAIKGLYLNTLQEGKIRIGPRIKKDEEFELPRGLVGPDGTL